MIYGLERPSGTLGNARERGNDNRKKIFTRILLIFQRDLYFKKSFEKNLLKLGTIFGLIQ
jgi:hypothetical protein